MKRSISSMALTAEQFMSYEDLVNYRGGCDLQTCIDCVNTAAGTGGSDGACGYSCSTRSDYDACYSGCVRNVSSSCFANFSDYSGGCYCN